MGQRAGEIDPVGAARVLEVSTETVRRWARAVLAGERGGPITRVRRDLVGRMWLDREEIHAAARAHDATGTTGTTGTTTATDGLDGAP
jgi:hypothetical protein